MLDRNWICTITQSGLYAMWETGGAKDSNTGTALIVAGKRGQQLKPTYIIKGSNAINRRQALFIVEIGSHLIRAARFANELTIDVYKVIKREYIKHHTGVIKSEWITSYALDEWVNDLPGYLFDAVEAARLKVRIINCDYPVYSKSTAYSIGQNPLRDAQDERKRV